MASSLFPNKPNPLQMISEFKKFANGGISPEEAEKKVEELVKQGKINKNNFNSIVSRAKELKAFLK